MTSVKWIKITTDMFDDEKIKIIQVMPEGDALLVIWIKLIILAGKTNDGGYIYISNNIPYTDEMLSVIMNKPLNIIQLAMNTFIKLGMIESDENGIYLVNFEKHQSLDKLEKMKEQNRLRVAKFRAKQKEKLLINDSNESVMLQVMESNAIDKNKNRIDKNRIDNKEEIIKEESKPVKHKLGTYKNVLLTDEELQSLKRDYDNCDELINYLDEYIEMKGYKAKSHYLCIKKWVVKAVKQNCKKTDIDWNSEDE